MLSREGKQTDRGAVGAEFIGYNRRRREALLLQEFPHQPNCRPSVPAGLNQEIQDFALTVHGTPEIELPPSNYDDHLVQVPAFGRSWPPTLNPPRIGPTEFQDPSSNCLIRDVETTLGKQVLNVPIAQRETAIEPDGMLDDDRWKAVTTVGYLAHPETLKHRPCRSHAVNVTMPAKSLRLGVVISRGVERFVYTYDYGDNWRHDVIVEEVRDGAPDREVHRLRLHRRPQKRRRDIPTGSTTAAGYFAVAECGDPEVAEQYLPIIHLVFANLKTWLIGIHHGVSHQHLQAYLNESTFRFNRRFYPFNAFRSLLGIAGDTSAPTYAELYSGEWRHPYM